MNYKLSKYSLLSLFIMLCTNVFADEVTLRYSGTTTAFMTGENDAALLSLDATAWSVVGDNGNNAILPGLNKAGDLRLYWKDGGGNTVTVTSLTGAIINYIVITFTNDDYANASVTVNGNAVSGVDGLYTINSSSFVVGNANTMNTQVRINNIVINYAADSTPLAVYDFSVFRDTDMPTSDLWSYAAGDWGSVRNAEGLADATAINSRLANVLFTCSGSGNIVWQLYAANEGYGNQILMNSSSVSINLPEASAGDEIVFYATANREAEFAGTTIAKNADYAEYTLIAEEDAPTIAMPRGLAIRTITIKKVSGSVGSSGTCGENLTWTFSSDTSTLTISGTGDMTDYEWGATPWYRFRDYIQQAVIDNGLTSIGDGAFYGCSGLTSITIPAGVTSIGEYAFAECVGLTSITIPAGVTSISHGSFLDCSSITSITIPAGVTSIGDYAFYGCSGLTTVTIPDGVTSIGDYAFEECSGLMSITIPDGVTSIGNEAFGQCASLGISSLSPWLTPDMYSKISSYQIYLNNVKIQEITRAEIPDDISTIRANAFNGFTYLTSVTFPDGLTSIGESAFYDCSGLTSITIPDGVTSIDGYTFSGCSGLTSIIIPAGLTSIGDYAFRNCTGLTSITIPGGVTSIGVRAFSGCSGLTSITIPDGVSSIGDYAFYGCSGLSSIAIPNGVTSIGNYVFNGCSGLTSITFPDGVTSIGNYAFRNCTFRF